MTLGLFTFCRSAFFSRIFLFEWRGMHQHWCSSTFRVAPVSFVHQSLFSQSIHKRASAIIFMFSNLRKAMTPSSNQNECPELPLKPELSPSNEICVVSLGWFWGPQLRFKRVNGVERCIVGELSVNRLDDELYGIPLTFNYAPRDVLLGYSGGKELNPTYRSIKDHTESVLIEFDPNVISNEDLLIEVRYWRITMLSLLLVLSLECSLFM